MVQRNVLMILVGLSAIALAACSDGPPTPGEPRAFGAVCDKANDGQRVAVQGYLQLPESLEVVTYGDGSKKQAQSVVLRMFETDRFQGNQIGVNLNVGTGPNTMDDIPGEYIFTDSDLKVHLADGQTSTYGQRVNVSGKVYFPSDGTEFSCGLTNPLVESS